MKNKVGLVLTGGGARGAYQAGFLRGIAEISSKHVSPFPIITGFSAGSINAAFLACYDGTFHESVTRLWDIWATLKVNDVFVQNKSGFASLALRALMNICLGNVVVKPKWPASILDNSPLRVLLDKNIQLNAIDKRIKNGDLCAVAFSASNFSSQITTTFFEARDEIQPWVTKDTIGIKTQLNEQHVMASSAIPGIFRLEEIDGSFYGDGSTRVTFPLAPVINLGADKILAIDMRHAETPTKESLEGNHQYPELGEIFATLLDSIFSDSLDRDLERLDIVNDFLSNCPDSHQKWRIIPWLLIRPSQPLGAMANDIFDSLSRRLRRILAVAGISRGQSADLVSHLAFERIFTERLLELGRKDALDNKTKLLTFLEIEPR